MRTKWMLLAGGLAMMGTACTPQEMAWWAEHPEHWDKLTTVDVAAPDATVVLELCLGTEVFAYATDDPGQTTLDCDLVPPQTLTIVFDEVSWGDHETWGGDASLAWADEQCADMGGTAEWHDGEWLNCRNVDY